MPSALMQGPSQKNKALQDLEYVLHAMSHEQYANSNPEYPHVPGRSVHFSLDTDRLVIARCPNGKTYHISIAFKHANLAYFMLQGDCSARILKRLAGLIRYDGDESKPADTLESGLQTAPIYGVEQVAIQFYTGSGHKVVNRFMRGQSLLNSNGLDRLFALALLIVSGVNKNISADMEYGERRLIRKDDKLPNSIERGMAQPGTLFSRRGMLSTSISNNFGGNGCFIRVFSHEHRVAHTHQKSIAAVSSCGYEQEVLLPPGVFVTEQYGAGFHARPVVGVAAESLEQYSVELALSAAHQLLKQPYRDLPDPYMSSLLKLICRQNHALAHHVRVVSFVDRVVDYMAQYAADEDSRRLCQKWDKQNIDLIKVVLAFSKTGRESEIAYSHDPVRYQQYQEASCQHLRDFLLRQLSLTEWHLAFYVDVLRYMGNPTFSRKVTGDASVKLAKCTVNDVITLCHKLDLMRCYSSSQYQRALQPYSGTTAAGEHQVVVSSQRQRLAFQQLQRFALNALKETGDNIRGAKSYVDNQGVKGERFVLANSSIEACLQYCMKAEADTYDQKIQTKPKLSSFMIMKNQPQQHVNYSDCVSGSGVKPLKSKYQTIFDQHSLVRSLVQPTSTISFFHNKPLQTIKPYQFTKPEADFVSSLSLFDDDQVIFNNSTPVLKQASSHILQYLKNSVTQKTESLKSNYPIYFKKG